MKIFLLFRSLEMFTKIFVRNVFMLLHVQLIMVKYTMEMYKMLKVYFTRIKQISLIVFSKI